MPALTVDRRGSVEFTSALIQETARPPLALLEPTVARGPDSLVVCSWCKRAHLGDWVELERAAELLGADGASRPPRLVHGICDTCSAMVDAVASGGRRACPTCSPASRPRPSP